MTLLLALACATTDTDTASDAVDSASPPPAVAEWLDLEVPCEPDGVAWSIDIPARAVVLQVLECQEGGCISYPDFRTEDTEGLWVDCRGDDNWIRVVAVPPPAER